MIEPEIRASEVHVLLPDIRLERSECTARTQVPFSFSYLGTRELRSLGTAIRNKTRNELTTRHVCVSSPCQLTTNNCLDTPTIVPNICSQRLVSRAGVKVKALPVRQ
jgi:hypothetical protein